MFRFGYGLDAAMELIDVALDLGIISKGGAWFTLPNGEKLQGKDKVRNYFIENPELMDEINTKFRDMMGLSDASV